MTEKLFRYDAVNIVGMGRGMELAPPQNCWGVNSVIFDHPVDVHFDMHHDGRMNEKQIERRKRVIEKANSLDIPVFACHDIPGTTYVRYPIERVVGEFSTGFFSNTICYMIALAILDGMREINFYGVNHSRINMMDDYLKNKPGVDFWLGICKGRGIKCNVYGSMAEIGKTYTGRAYGYFLTQGEMIERYGSCNRIGNR